MTSFTPVSGFVGGLLIGLAATLLIVVNGRVAGISGIVDGVLSGPGAEIAWRLAFLAGLVLGPLVYEAVTGTGPAVEIQAGLPLLTIAGLLVGYGTRLGHGCTSGHGVCGIARGSPRSLAATAMFFGTAALVVFVVRHVLGD